MFVFYYTGEFTGNIAIDTKTTQFRYFLRRLFKSFFLMPFNKSKLYLNSTVLKNKAVLMKMGIAHEMTPIIIKLINSFPKLTSPEV